MNEDWLFIPSPGMMMDYIAGHWRKEQEEKPIALNTALSAALNKCPSPWIDGICMYLGLDLKALRLKKAKVQAIIGHLSDPETLREVTDPLPDQSRGALTYTLEQGGWVKVGQLTRKFGPMDDIGWFWDEEESPVSPLGRLRVRGLLFVGKAGMGGRNYTVAVIPRDLHKPLETVL
jgi:hypothetical protein